MYRDAAEHCLQDNLTCTTGHKLKLSRFFSKTAVDLLNKADQVPSIPLLFRRKENIGDAFVSQEMTSVLALPVFWGAYCLLHYSGAAFHCLSGSDTSRALNGVTHGS